LTQNPDFGRDFGLVDNLLTTVFFEIILKLSTPLETRVGGLCF